MESNPQPSRVLEALPFQSLEFGTRWNRWLWSLAIHAGVVLVLIAIPVTVDRAVEIHNRVAVTLLAPPREEPVKTAHRRVETKSAVRAAVVKVRQRVPFQVPPQDKTRPREITLPPLPVETPAPVEIVRLETPRIELPQHPAIKPDVVSLKPASKPVKTGGFGDPNGVPFTANPSEGLTVRNVGLFDASAGPSYGRGVSGNGKTVASSGFGAVAAVGPSGGGNFRTPVSGAGFGDYDVAPRAARATRTPAPVVETAVEITFKPKPAYTAEARLKRVEGEVLLDVIFTSSGQIRVLRLVRGLGFGLDESARTAASQIRFRPAVRNGNPVDITGTVHIVFELS